MGALFTEDLVHVLGDGELMAASGKSLDQECTAIANLQLASSVDTYLGSVLRGWALCIYKNTSMPCEEHTWAVSNGDDLASYKHKSTRNVVFATV